MSHFYSLLGGSWVVINRVISRVTIVITHIRGLITPSITTHERPSRPKTTWRLRGDSASWPGCFQRAQLRNIP